MTVYGDSERDHHLRKLYKTKNLLWIALPATGVSSSVELKLTLWSRGQGFSKRSGYLIRLRLDTFLDNVKTFDDLTIYFVLFNILTKPFR